MRGALTGPWGARRRGRPLRIVHGSPFYSPSVGGGEGQVQAISERLAARGHAVTVITRKHLGVTEGPDASLPTYETLNGVAVQRLSARTWPAALLQRFLRVPGSWRLLSQWFGNPRLRALVEGPLLPEIRWRALRLQPDVIAYSNYYFAGMGYGLFGTGRRGRCPHVGIPLLHLEDPWSRDAITLDLLRRSTALLVNTAYEARFAVSVGVPAAAVHVLGNGVDLAAFAAPCGARVRAAHGIERAPVVGYVGRLSVGKGTVTLIEAMKRVWRSAPTARLLLAGRRFPPGSDADRPVAAALGGLSVAERERVIHIQRFSDAEKPSLLHAVDVFAMPSTSESFGIAFLEAWSCEKPVVAARIGAVECVVDHGIDGLLVPPADPDATADAILTMLADPALRKRSGVAGRLKTESHFTWDRLTDVVEDLYLSLAGQPALEVPR